MKIILLLGAGETAKRNQALKIKKEFSPDDISTIDLKEQSEKDLEMALSSTSLFGSGQRLVIVENVPDKLDLENIKSADDNVTLLLLADTPRADCSLLKIAKKLKATIYSFEGEKELTAFPFIDNLIEGKKTAFLELEKLLAEYGGMYVLAMIYYLLRRNLLPSPASSFMKEKIGRQKRKYNLEDFEVFYKTALETEFYIKSGFTDEKMGLVTLTQKIIGQEQYEELRDIKY
ncbi:MAG: hypothetical protein V1808_03005 [Candidatus Daviesbacteria bacterium]